MTNICHIICNQSKPPTPFSVSNFNKPQPTSPSKLRIRNREMSLSRLFRPNNDRSILKNLIADHEGWEKIAQKPYTEVKKTKLVSLNQQIDSFAAKWGFKGIGVLWHPQFIKDLLTLKENESTQSSGQKVFMTIWVHPLLLSLRVAKYCPAIGYGGSDMTIMSKAVTAVNDKIVVNNDLRNLEVIDDSFHMPEPDEDDEEKEVDLIEDLIEDLVVTEEMGMNRVTPLDNSARSMSSLERQDAFDLSEVEKEELEDEPEATIADKIEPKLEKSSNDGFDIRSILCGYRHEVNPDVKIEDEEKPKVTIIGFHPPTSLPMERPNQQLINLPRPTSTKIGEFPKIFIAENSLRILISEIILSVNSFKHKLSVFESSVENDGFTDDLDPEYLEHLGRSFCSGQEHTVPTVMSVVTIDTAEHVPNAPKAERRREEFDADITLPSDMFDTSANDSGDSPQTLREHIEERRAIHEAAKACYSASTPVGKYLRSERFEKRFPK